MTDSFLAELEAIIEKGDNAAFDRFLLDHFKEFPKETQSQILMGWLEESTEKIAEKEALADFQEDALELLSQLRTKGGSN